MDFTITPGAIIQVTTRSVLYGQTMLNTFHYRAADEITEGVSALQGLGGDFNGTVQNEMALLQSDNVQYSPTLVQMIYPTRYLPIVVATALAVAGDIGSPAHVSAVAATVRRYGIVANKSNRGRIYLGGLPITFAGDGDLSPAEVTAFDDLSIAMQSEITGPATNVWTPVVYERTAPALSEEIVLVQVGVPLRTQRRRQVGRGI